ncbi:MAG TPA: 3-hydroxyacyl-ACP dehydratase FabZ [Kofleriaceae bacterium]|jgi:beta-hydroxyacyl-ACP dehydratase FabZ|nr:3-hydroxyacyl-ACP dehydratase FabZ [Kofleriaceae bacterium]
MAPEAAMKAEQILGLLPHRYPFLLIDRVLEISDDKVIALKNVTFNEPYFQGHFPGVPVMPGVLQIEAMAQAGGILASRAVTFDPTTHVMLFMAIDAVKFRKAVTPGDQLIIEVVPLRKGKIFKMKGEIKCDGQVVSSAEFLAGLAEKSKVG